MLTLSIHITHLITWATSVFSIALTSSMLNEESKFSYYLILTILNAVISCFSGYFLSTYLITQLQEALSTQILQVFIGNKKIDPQTLDYLSKNKAL